MNLILGFENMGGTPIFKQKYIDRNLVFWKIRRLLSFERLTGRGF